MNEPDARGRIRKRRRAHKATACSSHCARLLTLENLIENIHGINGARLRAALAGAVEMTDIFNLIEGKMVTTP